MAIIIIIIYLFIKIIYFGDLMFWNSFSSSLSSFQGEEKEKEKRKKKKEKEKASHPVT
jgi:flagellar basal body-associated protein FliL